MKKQRAHAEKQRRDEVLLVGKWNTGQQTLERAMTWVKKQELNVKENYHPRVILQKIFISPSDIQEPLKISALRKSSRL